MTSEQDHPIAEAGDEAMESLLAEGGLELFPDAVRRQVDDLLAAGQSLEPGARAKLIEAAKRGTRAWSLRESAALETLLFEARRTRGDDAEVIAASMGVDAGVLRSIERGESVLASQSAELVAAWALELEIDRPLLDAALRRSLGTRGVAPAYAGEPAVRLDPDQEQFVDDVLRAYDERSTERG